MGDFLIYAGLLIWLVGGFVVLLMCLLMAAYEKKLDVLPIVLLCTFWPALVALKLAWEFFWALGDYVTEIVRKAGSRFRARNENEKH